MDHHDLFIRSPGGGHLGAFDLGKIINKAAINTEVFLGEYIFSFFTGKYLKVGVLSLTVIVCFTYVKLKGRIFI